jgi:hypothetical protein
MNKPAAIILVIVAAIIFLPMMRPTAAPPASPLPSPAMTPEQRELKEKVGKLAMRVTFTRYDADGNGKLDAPELRLMLADAGIGNFITRGTWVSSIVAALDSDRDGMVSWDELIAGLGR